MGYLQDLSNAGSAAASKLYEDWIAGRINEANFTRMMEKAQSEQETLQKKADMMRQRLEGAEKEQEDNSKWLSLIKQYADIKEFDREMLHLLIKEIVVHEDITEDGRNTTVEIHWNNSIECWINLVLNMKG